MPRIRPAEDGDVVVERSSNVPRWVREGRAPTADDVDAELDVSLVPRRVGELTVHRARHRNVASLPAPEGAHLARVDWHLVRRPFALLTESRTISVLTAEYLPTRAGGSWRRRVVTAAPGDRLPGPGEVDLYVALAWYWNQMGRPAHGWVYGTLADLRRVMAMTRGGGQTSGLVAGLQRLAATRIHETPELSPDWKAGDGISILDDVHAWRGGERRGEDGAEGGVWAVRLGAAIVRSASRRTRLVDVRVYYALATPLARRLYLHLDCVRWQGSDRRDEVRTTVAALVRDVAMQQTKRVHADRQLDQAWTALKKAGFLRELPTRYMVRAGRTAMEQAGRSILLTPGPGHNGSTPTARPVQRADAAEEGDVMGDVEAVLELIAEMGKDVTRRALLAARKELGPEDFEDLVRPTREAIAAGRPRAIAAKQLSRRTRIWREELRKIEQGRARRAERAAQRGEAQ